MTSAPEAYRINLDKAVAYLRRADKQQASLTRRQRPVVDRGHLGHVGADARRRPGTRQQRLRVAKDEVGDHRSSITEASRVEAVESPPAAMRRVQASANAGYRLGGRS